MNWRSWAAKYQPIKIINSTSWDEDYVSKVYILSECKNAQVEYPHGIMLEYDLATEVNIRICKVLHPRLKT